MALHLYVTFFLPTAKALYSCFSFTHSHTHTDSEQGVAVTRRRRPLTLRLGVWSSPQSRGSVLSKNIYYCKVLQYKVPYKWTFSYFKTIQFVPEM